MAYSNLRLLFFSLLSGLQCKGYELQPRVSDFSDYCAPDKINNVHFEQTLELIFKNENEINIDVTVCSIKLTSLQSDYIRLNVVLNDDEFDDNGNNICDEGNYIEVLDTEHNSLHVWCRNEGRYLYSNKSEVFLNLRLRRFTKVTSFRIKADEYTDQIFETDPALSAMYIFTGIIVVLSICLFFCVCCCKRGRNTGLAATSRIRTVSGGDYIGPSPHSPLPQDNFSPPSYSTAVRPDHSWTDDNVTHLSNLTLPQSPPSYDEVLNYKSQHREAVPPAGRQRPTLRLLITDDHNIPTNLEGSEGHTNLGLQSE